MKISILFVFVFWFFSDICPNESKNFSGNIFIIGDSHTTAFARLPKHINGKIIQPFYKMEKPGHPASMYRVGRDNAENIVSESDFGLLQDGDAIVFCYGYVDVNWLIWKQVNIKERDLDQVVEDLVEKYLNAISNITNKNIIKIVYNILPPIYDCSYCKFIGTFSDRITYSNKMNAMLASECASRKIEFLDIYAVCCDERGQLLAELRDGEDCHIKPSSNDIILEILCHILERSVLW